MRLLIFLCLLGPAFNANAQSVFDSLYDARTQSVYFASAAYALDAPTQVFLDSVAKAFIALPGKKQLRIMAHTDSVGSMEFNEKLAQQRADAVRNHLTAKGVAPSDIVSVEAYGERDPVAANDSEPGRRRNRRATIEIGRLVPMTTWAGRVTDQKTGAGLASTILFRTKKRIDSLRTDTSGHYSVRLPKDSVVKVEAVAAGHFFATSVVKLYGSPDLYRKYKISPVIALPPALPGEKVAIRNLYFLGGLATLLKASEGELPKVLKFMQLNPNLTVELVGHINNPCPEGVPHPCNNGLAISKYSDDPRGDNLSTNRAKVVHDYLLENGIPPQRVSYKGLGDREMVKPYARTPEEMEENRRVEIRVVGKGGL